MTAVEQSGVDLSTLTGRGRELVLAAAVRERFQPSQLISDWLNRNRNEEAPGDLDDVLDAALSLGAVVGESAERKGGAELPLNLRQEVLARATLDEIKVALGNVERATATELQFSNLISGLAPKIDAMGRGDLQAVAAAAAWSENLNVTYRIDPAKVRQRIFDQEFVERVGGTDLQYFVGRDDLLRTLRHIWDVDVERRPVVLIEGPGGIGKSVAVARFFQTLLQDDDTSVRPDAILHLDFDLPWMQQATALDMSMEIVRQLAERWMPEYSAEFRFLLRRFGGYSQNDRSSRYSPHQILESRDYRRRQEVDILEQAVRYLSANLSRRARIILFADSFERAEGLDEVAAHNVPRIVETLRASGADLMVIYAARAFRRPDDLAIRSRMSSQNVTRFTQDEAVSYLTSKARQRGINLSRELADRANRDLKGWPLGLRIAVSLLGNEPERFDSSEWLRQIEGGGRTVQATLYERLLDRILDEDLRRLAKPGLLVRRISPEVIERVLARPCGLSSDANGRELIAKAEEEGQLFWRDRSDPGALWHRQDLREIMLPILRREVSKEIIRMIHDSAVDYYADRRDDTSRAEELYHRLCRGDSRDQILPRWRQSAGYRLVNALDELPREAAAIVRQLLGGGRRDAAMDLDELRAVAQNRLSESVTELSDIFDAADVDSGLFSPLGDIYAQSLIERRRFEELLIGAEIVPDAPGVPRVVKARIMIAAATAAEGILDLDRALAFRRYAYRSSRLLNEVEQLSLRISLARLVRKIGHGHFGRHAHILAACDLLAQQARQEESLFSSSPVLRLEAVAELSEVLQPVRHWHERADPMARRELQRFFRDLSPMFPSALDNQLRLQELAAMLGLDEKRVQTERELGNLMFKYFDSSPNLHARALAALRSEVDASFALAVGGGKTRGTGSIDPPQEMA